MKKIFYLIFLSILISSSVFAEPSIIVIPSSQGDQIEISGESFGNTQGRVTLCNGGTWLKKGIYKNQQINTWTDTKIVFNLLFPNIINIRKDGIFRYSYLYVVDVKKEANASGVKIYLNLL